MSVSSDKRWAIGLVVAGVASGLVFSRPPGDVIDAALGVVGTVAGYTLAGLGLHDARRAWPRPAWPIGADSFVDAIAASGRTAAFLGGAVALTAAPVCLAGAVVSSVSGDQPSALRWLVAGGLAGMIGGSLLRHHLPRRPADGGGDPERRSRWDIPPSWK